jgi:AcrR family transcriptional regulator
MSRFQRARKPEEVALRRVHLLATARRMLESGVPLHDLGMNELARHAKMTKSNVYRYFESREQVLLELLHDEWSAWFGAMTASWRSPKKGGGRAPLRHLAEHLSATLADRPLLCALSSALPTVLERNLSDTAIIEFKRLSLMFFDQAAAFMAAKVPELTHADGMQLLHDGTVFLTGLWPHAHPVPAVQRAIAAAPELGCFVRDFAGDLSRYFYAIAVDLIERRVARPGESP